ncbi:hypothetical protein GCK72_009441 [Caenorhabditis remanei]|uniref:DEP domain-containing protein n=1 Tax=Caenorhabditis remanei TaxID=31234 RepID=A0A6A5H1R4_CAERE|nr:hypothetical protein GCK72_009441 [Caenorhabditis remanei]KAF1761187.1 hypothetical protein GCK72_009441 [Caenorhabditis remanei]
MADDYSTDQFKATQMFDEIVWHFRANLPLKSNRSMLTTVENSFTGKEALDFLLLEVPRIIPDKVPTVENMQKLLMMMVDWKIVAEAFPKRNQRKREFSDSRVYIFIKSLDELKKPKPRSRRSASFSGGRKSVRVTQPVSPSATMLRRPKLSRRLSRSNGNIDKAGVDNDPRGVENHGFDDQKEEDQQKSSRRLHAPKILNRSLESICTEHISLKADFTEKKEKVYDWLPFFKSRRYHTKAHQPTRRSVSLDRNHCMVEEEIEEAARNKKKVTTPPIRELTNDLVFMHPKGPMSTAPARYQSNRVSIVGTNPASLSRGRMYESIVRRPSIPVVETQPPALKDCIIWKTEMLARLELLYDRPIPSEWANKVDGYDINWNMLEIDANDGVVKSRCSGLQPDYPTTIVHFMDYLGRYPFSSGKKLDFVPELNVNRMFGTLVNRLEDLNAPLQSEDCSLIVSFLSKMDGFAMMMETGAGRRWSKVIMSTSVSSIEEAGLMVDGFSRDIPSCGIRASKHRRRALSPFDNRVNLPIQDEKAYKVREKWLIESLQLILLSLPTSRRRKLHKFVCFIKSIETNQLFDLADPSNGSSNNREAAIIGLWTGVCGGCRKQQGMLITAVLLANYRTLFAVPEEFVERVQRLEYAQNESYDSSRYPKVNRSRRTRNQSIVEETPSSPAALKKTSKETFTAEKSKKGLFTRLLRK